MSAQAFTPLRRDWSLFGLRWLAIGFYAFLTLVTQEENVLAYPALVAAVANGVFGLVLLSRWRPLITAALLISDLVIAGVFIVVNAGNTDVLLGIVPVSIFLTLVRTHVISTLIHVVGISAIVIVALLNARTAETVGGLLESAARVPVLEMLVIGLVGIVCALILEQFAKSEQVTFSELAREKSAQLEDIRERTRAIYELMATFRETYSFEHLLNAALEAGHLGLRKQSPHKLVAAVLLFRADESGLCVVASRRFRRADADQVVPGRSGVIGEALREGIPVIGERGRTDPELTYFTGFHNTRSVLCIPLRASYDNFGVLIYGSDNVNAFTNEHIEVLAAIGVQATIAIQNFVLYRSFLEEKERIARVAQDERKQLARQLHDGPTQKVSAMVMMIRIIRKMLERSPEKLPDELTKMEEIAVTTSQEMRYMLFTLRPMVLESQGLTAALEDLATKTQQTHGQRVEIYVEPGIERHLDSHKQATVFYLVEEAINNARKYAQAGVINTEVRRQGRDLVITIHDDGVGFDVEAVLKNHAKSGSLGMVNMRERAAMINGTLDLASAPGSGTRITIVAPLVIETPRMTQHDSAIADIALDTLKVGHHERSYMGEARQVQRNGNLSHR